MKPYAKALLDVAERIAELAVEMDMYNDIRAWPGDIQIGTNDKTGNEAIVLQCSDDVVFILQAELGTRTQSVKLH